jgi:putative SOS response-associated peptidase YedK
MKPCSNRGACRCAGMHRDIDELHPFGLLTGAPNELVAPIHNRMPVILPRYAWSTRLGEQEVGEDELLALLRLYLAG